MNQRRVLVTGGAGYIGSHTARALALAGIEPVVFDDLSNGHAEAVKWGPLVVGDVRDGAAVEACIRAQSVTAVIHFAGLIEVGRSVLEPDLFRDHNVNGVDAVLGAMRRTGLRRIVLSSTAAVYGRPEGDGLAPLVEGLPLRPINPYGETKLEAERLIAGSAGIEGVALRYFNAAGADPDGELGEAHHPESHLIPRAIEAALGLGPPLTVFGDDFPTPDGACVRDYVHVSDLARAHVMALDLDLGRDAFAALNLGVGRGASVLEVIGAVDRATGRRTPWAPGPRRPGDPAVLIADPAAAHARLAWTPRFPDLDEIVRTAVAWRMKPAFGLAAPDRAV
ncbi:MAG: UDP-glucose 4-epimerase GalE [Pseudomonadota bacterium]|nr:UDP-glucose 4-epimerase GalE [Pseudomonadota bacterium]